MPELTESGVLRLEQCPQCGYRLEGLPAEGVCPECGRAYEQTTIVLHGWSSGGRMDISTARPWVAALLGLLYAWYVWDAVQQQRRFGLSNPLAYFCPACAGVMIIWGLWRRWSSDMPGLVQVRMNADGCCQLDATRDLSKRPALIPWAAIHKVEIGELAQGRARLRFGSLPPWYRMQHYSIDAIVNCTPEQLRAVRAKVSAWRKAATEQPSKP